MRQKRYSRKSIVCVIGGSMTESERCYFTCYLTANDLLNCSELKFPLQKNVHMVMRI